MSPANAGDSGIRSTRRPDTNALILHRRSDEEAVLHDSDWFERHGLDPRDAETGDEPLPDFLG